MPLGVDIEFKGRVSECNKSYAPGARYSGGDVTADGDVTTGKLSGPSGEIGREASGTEAKLNGSVVKAPW